MMNIEQTHQRVVAPYSLKVKARRNYLVFRLVKDELGEVSPIKHQAIVPEGMRTFLPVKNCIIEVSDEVIIWAPTDMADVPTKFTVRVIGIAPENTKLKKNQKMPKLKKTKINLPVEKKKIKNLHNRKYIHG